MPSGLIDFGHGGVDPGAVAQGYQEKDVTLRIGGKLHDRLVAHRFGMNATRYDDQFVGLTNRQIMAQRSGADFCLSKHLNAGGGRGFEIWRSMHRDSGLAQAISGELLAIGWPAHGEPIKTKHASWSTSVDYYAMNKTGATEGLILELGFIDSDDLWQILQREGELVEAIVRGICKHFGVTYVPLGGAPKPRIMLAGQEFKAFLLDGRMWGVLTDLLGYYGMGYAWDGQHHVIVAEGADYDKGEQGSIDAPLISIGDAEIPGKIVQVDGAGKTIIPLRDFLAALGKDVGSCLKWDAATQTATVE